MLEVTPHFGEEAIDTQTGRAVWWDGHGWSYTKPENLQKPLLENGYQSLPPLTPQSRPPRIPLSFAQSRLWLIDQLEGTSTEYNMPESVRLRGELDLEALKRTIDALVERHESLRTHFAVLNGEPVQIIEPKVHMNLLIEDLSSLDESSRREQVMAAQRQEWMQPFDLTHGPLLRMKLLKLAERDHVLLRSFHHIVFDGWSLGVFNREFMLLYEAFHGGRQNPLPPLPVQYADFALWQRKWLDKEGLQRHLDYWKEHLAGIPERLELPHDHPRGVRQTFAAGLCKVSLSTKELEAVRRTSQSNDATLYMTLLSALAVLLHRYSNQHDIVIGSPIANRQEAQLEQLIGFFVNSLVMRVKITPESSFAELLAAVRTSTLEAFAHQDLPFERLVEELAPQRSLNTTPIFQIIFAVQNAPMGSQKLKDLEVEAERIRGEELRTRFDMELHVWERDDGLDLLWVYNRDMFSRWRIEQMARHFKNLLDSAGTAPEKPILEMEMLGEAEKQQVLVEWNRTGSEHPACCVHELFEQWAERTPDALAASYEKESLSYRELNQHANRLACYLIKLGVGPEVPVGICLERSLEMIVGLLGILKAGGIYVPIASELPDLRRDGMIADAGLRHIITANLLRTLFDGRAKHVITLDGDAAKLADQSQQNPAVAQFAASPAYVNYTSGSTGQPKGVLVSHASVMRLVCGPNYIRLDSSSRMLQMAPLSFDAATLEIWGTLLNGGSLVIMPAGPASVEEIGEVLRRQKVNTAWLTAGLFHEVVDHALDSLITLRQLLAGGDVLSSDHVKRLLNAHPQCQLINGYGPTENTTFTCCYPVVRSAGFDHGVPIGFPINNTRVYVLDANLKPVPVGVTGELYTAGEGLARGYLNRPDLTAARFIPNPYGAAPGDRMYQTGDLVRWRADGVIEFVGRNDHQVKIRGFRVELGEIEKALQAHASVQDALVTVREQDGNKQLLGYVVARQDAPEKAQGQGSKVFHWRQLYETTYRQGRETAGDFNIVGWNSSYTGQPIPANEMRIWVEETVAHIRKMRPRKVLEIGCGTGLLLTRVAADCETYVGLDFSAEVLAQLGEYLAGREDLKHVVLRQGLAHELSFLNDDSVDLVILNSVVQYFPNVDYLLDVLAESVRVVKRGGHIFVGDVRSLPLLDAYHASVQLDKAQPDTLLAELRQRILHARYSEEELVVDPALFVELARRWEKVGRADPTLKAGAYDNELSRFRYDVVLQLGTKERVAEPEQWLSWDGGGRWREELEQALRQQPGMAVGLRGLRDLRVARAAEALRLMRLDETDISSAEQLQMAASLSVGEDPDLVMNLARRLGVECCWQGFRSDGTYDVVFRPGWENVDAIAVVPKSHFRQYGNAPAQMAEIAKLGRELQEHLRERLPEYMVPAVIMVLPAWPLTKNGKVDRRALPAPEWRRENYRAPRTPQEEILCEIFAEVLALESVGVDENFFELGGHSLMAMRLVTRVHATLGSELALRTLFEFPTVAQLAPHLYPTANSRPPLVPQARPKQLPLSYAQQRLWFLDRLESTSTEYNLPEALRLRGTLDFAALYRAVATMVERHESLRTRFGEVEGKSTQIIEPALEIGLPVEDLTNLDEATRCELLSAAMRQEREQPFDLSRGPLLRMKLLKLGEKEHMLLRTFHHIICDGWSQGIFNREFMTLYEIFHEGRENPLAALPVQYADFALWQRSWLNDETLTGHLDYWKKQLSGIPDQLSLPRDRARQPLQTFDADLYRVALSSESLAALKRLSHASHSTLYMTLLATFAVLLQRHSGQDDILVGSPIANRQDAQLEQLIGFFVNSLVMRVRINAQESFSQLLRIVRKTTLEAYAHQDLPFERLVEQLSPRRSLNTSPIFQVMFALQNAPMEAQQLKGLEVEPVRVGGLRLHFDLELHAWERDQRLELHWVYNSDLFHRDRIERMARHYMRLLDEILAGPETPVRELEMLGEEERQQILSEWNRTQAGYPRDKFAHRLFEEQAAETPNAEAVLCQGQRLTYAELNQRANRLANYLRKLGAGPEARIGIFLERSLDMVVALLAVLKAGAAYVPLDPAYPQERLNYMLEDAQVSLMLTHCKFREQTQSFKGTAVWLDADHSDIARESPKNPGLDLDSQNLAYVIYTSGSTGKPKGVAIRHGSTAVFLHWARDVFSQEELSGVLASTSICFDLSVFEIFVPLSWGGRVIVVNNALDVTRLVAEDGVTLINTVPSAMTELLRANSLPSTVRTVNLAGETLYTDLVQRIYQKQEVQRVFNLYGPSEDTTYSTCEIVNKSNEAASASIGRPITNTQTYVLDGEMDPVPVGVTGALYVGGDGLARGYLNRPDLTAERFVPDPFGSAAGARLYYTGDLVRYLPDGRLEFLGRSDYQVKIRGFRIELGEIEIALKAQEGIQDALVTVREHETLGKQLIGYVVPVPETIADMAVLRHGLRQILPEHMVPSTVMVLPAWPLTSNGKIDRKALPDPAITDQFADALALPQSDMEKTIAAIWQKVLHLETVSVFSNFFDLGGHSLLTVQVHAALKEVARQPLSLTDLFKYPTIASLAKYLTGNNNEQQASAGHDEEMERLTLGKARREKRLKKDIAVHKGTQGL